MTDPNLDRKLEQLRQGGPSAEWEHSLAGRLAGAVAPVTPLPGLAVRIFISFTLLVLSAAMLGFAAGGKGWLALDTGQRLSIGLPLTGLALWISAELASRMRPASRVYVPPAVAAIAAVATAAAWPFIAVPLEPMKLFYPVCVSFTCAGAFAATYLLSRWLRRGLFTAPGALWIFSAASGVAGFLAVEIFCNVLESAHIVTSHTVPAALVGSAAGFWLKRAVTR